MDQADGSILALDVGASRIGLAVASGAARLPHPAGFLPNDGSVLAALQEVCRREQVRTIVVGLPRGLDGQETQQTAVIRSFTEQLRAVIPLPVVWQDEAVTSAQAEAELRARGKPYGKGDIDALAATYILEDYLHVH